MSRQIVEQQLKPKGYLILVEVIQQPTPIMLGIMVAGPQQLLLGNTKTEVSKETELL